MHFTQRTDSCYLWQFDFLWNHRQLNDGERTILAVKAAEGKRLMYRDPVAEREYIKTREEKKGGEQLEPIQAIAPGEGFVSGNQRTMNVPGPPKLPQNPYADAAWRRQIYGPR